MVSTHLALSGIAVILLLTEPNPGPRLLILANTALKASKGSTPHAITLNKQIVNTNKNEEKKAKILQITRSSRTFLPHLIGYTKFG